MLQGIPISSFTVALLCLSCLPRTDHHDVVVYGGTSSGVAAAIQVARMGKSVVIVEPGQHLGGLTAGGLGWTDSGKKNVIGGISREFYQRIKRHYDQPFAWKYQAPEEYSRYRPSDDAMWTFEPHVAERIFRELLEEHGVPVHLGVKLDRGEGGVTLSDTDPPRVLAFDTDSGRRFRGSMFIDATYEGDLMAAAGVSYTVGREANDVYGETLNGVERIWNISSHRFVVDVDPYVMPGDPESGLLPGIDPGPREPDPVSEVGGLRRTLVRAAPAQLRSGRPAPSAEARSDAQRQNRHQQQLRGQHRLHRSELRVPRSRLRGAGEDPRDSSDLPAGADVDAGQPPPRTGGDPREDEPLGAAEGRVPGWRRLAAPDLRARGAAHGRRPRHVRARLPAAA